MLTIYFMSTYTLSQHSNTVWKHSYGVRVMGRTLPFVSNNIGNWKSTIIIDCSR